MATRDYGGAEMIRAVLNFWCLKITALGPEEMTGANHNFKDTDTCSLNSAPPSMEKIRKLDYVM